MGENHHIAFYFGLTTKCRYCHGGCQVVRPGSLRPLGTHLFICFEDKLFEDSTEIDAVATLEKTLYAAPFCAWCSRCFQLFRADRAAVCEAISPAALPPTPSKTAARPLCSSVIILSSLRSGCRSHATVWRAKVKGVSWEGVPPLVI